MTNIADALTALRPGSAWSMSNNDLSTLQWYDENTTAPTQVEVDAKIVELNAAATAEDDRVSTILGDAGRVGLLQQLKTANSSQINTWVDNNINSLADAKTVMKAVIKIIALNISK